jgi:hypothetical protein
MHCCIGWSKSLCPPDVYENVQSSGEQRLFDHPVFVYTSLSNGCKHFMMALQGPYRVGAVTIYRLLKAVRTQCVSLSLIQFLYIRIHQVLTSMVQAYA